MAKNYSKLIIAIIASVIAVLGIIFLLTTPFISRYEDSDNYGRIFIDGDTITRWGSVTVEGHDSDFPGAVLILGLIGIIFVLLGCAYMTLLAITEKDCYISNRKAPGPVTGILLGIGGLIGFIGMMVGVPYGKDIIEANSAYTFGLCFIFSLIVFILMLLYGIFLVVLTLMNKSISPGLSISATGTSCIE